MKNLVKSEEAEDYHNVLVYLNDDWRVIVCRAGIQWILQRRAGHRHGKTRWECRSYCRTSEAINRVSRGYAAPARADSLAVLAALPERIDDPVPEMALAAE